METNCSTLLKEELIFRVRSLITIALLLSCYISGYSQVIKTYTVSDVDPQCAFYTNNGYPIEGGHLDITSVTTYTAFPRNAGYALKVVGTSGTFKEYADGTATLDVVYNLADKTTGALGAENWTMHIDLVGRTTTAPPNFPMGGACGNASGTGFVYYNLDKGTVTSNIAGHGPYIIQNKDKSSLGPTEPAGGHYTAYFQLGNGASLRHPTAFGLGGWWDIIRVNNPDGAYPFGVGDNYLELTEIPSCTNPSITVNNTNPSICPGGNSSLSVSGCTGGTVAWSDGATGLTRVVSPAITTTYTATCTIGDCNGSASTSVTVTPNPTPTVNSPGICAGQSALLTVSNCAGTVNWGGGITGATRTVNPTTTTTYSATCTVGSCSGSATSTVTVTPAPTPTINSPSICAGQSTLLTVSNCSGTVVWNDATTGLTKTVNPTTTTTYSATCTVGSCSGSTTSTVTVNPLPTITLNASATNVTVGTPVSLTANGCSGNVAWSTSQTGSVITVTPANATQTYSATCTMATGCTATASITVTTQPAASLVVTSATICSGNSATLTASGCTGSVTWNTGATGATLVTPALTSTTSYTATCTTGTGSTTTTVGTVTVSPLPTLSLAASATNVTVGTPVSLTASGCSGNVVWSTSQTGSVITVTPANATQTYSATCTTATGCTGTASITVTTQPAASLVVTSATICSGNSATLTASGCTGSVTWNTGATGATLVTPALTSTTSYTATCTTGTGSTTTAVGTVTVSPLPTITLNASATNVTVGTPVSLTANGCSGNVVWSTSQTGSVITVTPANATQTYSATCTTPAGCTATASITVTTQPAPTCALTATVTTGNCVSASNTYSVTATIQLANGSTGILTISTGTTSQTIATTSSISTYTATLNGLNSDGATHSVVVSLAGCTSVTTTHTAPTSCTTATCPPPVHVCKGSGYVYQLNTTPDLGTYQWYRNGVAISGATSSTYNATQAGSYSVVVNGNVAGTCPDNSCCPAIIVEDSIPDFQVQTQTVTCQSQSNSVNSDGRILITNWPSGPADTTTYYYEISLGSTYDASQRIAGGSTTQVPSNGVLVASLPNPVSATGQTYTIRISSGTGCVKDETVTLPQTTCSCPPAKCVPFVIRRIR